MIGGKEERLLELFCAVLCTEVVHSQKQTRIHSGGLA